MKLLAVILLLLSCLSVNILVSQDSLIIQENTIGVCTMDGVVESSAGGYTGDGYTNIDDGIGIGMSWSFTVPDTNTYDIHWRYALGGSDQTSRDARLMINNVYTPDTVRFPHSGSTSWSVWLTTDTFPVFLHEGQNTIRLVSITHKGLPNIDYFYIAGNDIVPAQCVPSYTFTIEINDPDAGSVSYSPVQEFYEQGSEINVSASSNPGYFFHSWSGEAASTNSEHTFQIVSNTTMTALFYPEGTTMDEDATGYATIQHDNGTPYLLTGGSLGETVEASTLEELQSYLGTDEPYVVELSQHIQGSNTDEITISSDKTLQGISDNAHIEGIRVKLDAARNVIIRDIKFSKVIQFDEIEINNGSKNVWIDHCEFFTDLDHDIDYYDGLLDIKNQSSFITVSWSKFHDHQKCILISSGDGEIQDSVIRITFHHNYFYNCNSRLPSIRFGKAHIFNNLYYNAETGINSRMGACVRVEKNYFKDAGTGVGMFFSPEPGAVQLLDNIFVNTEYTDSPTCELDVPYEYSSFMNEALDLPDTIPAGTSGPFLPDALIDHSQRDPVIVFPNPVSGSLNVVPEGNMNTISSISIYNILGQKKMALDCRQMINGPERYTIDLSSLSPGIYYIQIQVNGDVVVRKIIQP
jgi:pectate lyase